MDAAINRIQIVKSTTNKEIREHRNTWRKLVSLKMLLLLVITQQHIPPSVVVLQLGNTHQLVHPNKTWYDTKQMQINGRRICSKVPI